MTGPGAGDDVATPSFPLVVMNFAGGKERAHHDSDEPRAGELAAVWSRVAGDGGSGASVFAVQEMTTVERGLPVSLPELEHLLPTGSLTSYVPRVATAWYPIAEKWARPGEGPRSSESEGLCLVTTGGGLTIDSWPSALAPDAAGSLCRIIDLPILEFAGDVADDGSTAWYEPGEPASDHVRGVRFRHAFYRGNRDTDPRVAQASVISHQVDGEPSRPVALLVNVHLSTLRAEWSPGETLPATRLPSREAAFLRHAQLNVVARFVREAREQLGLPVVVAGDFNAEPDAWEIRALCDAAGLRPLLTTDACWACDAPHEATTPVTVHADRDAPMSLSFDPAAGEPLFETAAVCREPGCLEPRFTHKRTGQLIDNVLVDASPASGDVLTWGRPSVDLSWGFTDHAVITVPFSPATTDAPSPKVIP